MPPHVSAPSLSPHNWLDWAIIAYVLIGAWWGYRIGLITALFNLVGEILGFVAASHYAAAVVAWQEPSRHLGARLGAWLAGRPPLVGMGDVPLTAATYQLMVDRLSALPLPEPTRQALLASLRQSVVTATAQHETVAQFLGGLFGHMALTAAALLLLFLVVLVIVRQISVLLTAVVGITRLGSQLNAVLGLVAGVAERYVSATVLIVALGSFAAMLNLTYITTLLHDSQLALLMESSYTWLTKTFGAIVVLL